VIHRDQNGYTRHYVGASNGGARPRRNPGGPTYLYHGRRFAPFRAAPYHWPRGQGHRRFHRHERFPRIFLIPEYFIDDYADYDLGPPPADAQWVRYGDDLILVDLDTGDILEVVAGAFADEGPGEDVAAPPDDGSPDEGPPPDGASPPPDDSAPPDGVADLGPS
jgi:Ni/Co efflux regulator RcnB